MENDQKPKTDKRLEILCEKLGIPISYLTHKSSICPHSEGCIENILKTIGKSFKYGYILRCVISLIGALIQLKSGNKKLNFIRKDLYFF